MNNAEHLNTELWSFLIKEENLVKVKTRYITTHGSKIIIRNIENIQQNELINHPVGQVVIGEITPNNCFHIKKFKNF